MVFLRDTAKLKHIQYGSSPGKYCSVCAVCRSLAKRECNSMNSLFVQPSLVMPHDHPGLTQEDLAGYLGLDEGLEDMYGSSSLPEHPGFSQKSSAEHLRPNEDGDVVHTPPVIASIHHPGGARGEADLVVW